MPYISEWLDFDLCYCIWWLDKKHPSATDDNITLGKCLGISHKVGSDMCYWILTVSVKVVAQTTVQYVVRTELINPDIKRWVEKFDDEL